MSVSVHGIHHVTAIAGHPQENLDFYVGTLGMRLVKKSVNQDVIDTYHLFFADAAGSPGTDLTFFPWPDMPPARLGIGFTIEVPFAVAKGSLDYWRGRFEQKGVSFGQVETRFGETVLPFQDPHGLKLALVESDDPRDFVPWNDSPVPAQHQLRGMHAVRLFEREVRLTELLLTLIGFQHVGTENNWRRYVVDGGGSGKIIELQERPTDRRGEWGTGGVHHVAWRVTDEQEELAVRAAVEAAGLRPTPIIDRFWFKSVYFKEPGGALFELATDGPGFALDESPEHLGEALVLAPWLEPQRKAIEAALTPLTMPKAGEKQAG